MYKEKGESISETGNWNVADKYSISKIMTPLNRCEYYEDIATFGYESIEEEFLNYKRPPEDFIRVRGLIRLIKELIKLIDNSKFALKRSGTKKTALKYRGLLKKINSSIPAFIKITHNQINKTQTVKIKSIENFEKILEKVLEIKSKINEPLNENHLIFTNKTEFDPKAFKDKIKRRMVEEG